MAGSLIDYVWLESRAAHIQSYATIVIPGLLQSAEYAEEVIRSDEPDATPDQVERWLELRMTRQQVLSEADSPHLSVILDEAVLHRQIGTTDLMAHQLTRLTELAALPTVNIRVLPLRAGTPASVYGTFGIFQLPEPFPDVAYTETLAGAIYTEAPDIQRFTRAYDVHENLALGPTESIELILSIAEEWH